MKPPSISETKEQKSVCNSQWQKMRNKAIFHLDIFIVTPVKTRWLLGCYAPSWSCLVPKNIRGDVGSCRVQESLLMGFRDNQNILLCRLLKKKGTYTNWRYVIVPTDNSICIICFVQTCYCFLTFFSYRKKKHLYSYLFCNIVYFMRTLKLRSFWISLCFDISLRW